MEQSQNLGNSSSIVTELWAGKLGFDSRREQRVFLFATASRPALGHIQPTNSVPGTLSSGVELWGSETDHSPTSSAEVKNAWSYTSTPSYVFMTWYLVKHTDKFTFTFTFTKACSDISENTYNCA
jgi:hypothetical protein